MSLSPPNNGSDDLIRHLTADLAPVQRLRSPAVRALLWLAVVAAMALIISARSASSLTATTNPRDCRTPLIACASFPGFLSASTDL